MTTIPATRSNKHGLPYNAASTRSSCTMVTMITTLTILGKSNWNETEIYPMLWMSWRTQQTFATTMTQMMTTATTTTLMREKIPKTKRRPILPTHKWEDGGYSQRFSHRCRDRNRCFFGCCCCCVHEFSPNLGKGMCVFGVWVLFWGIFLSIGVCVWGEGFVPKYHKFLGISGFLFI